MLATRTKQINAYGKRSKRVVDVSVSSGGPLPPAGIISIFDDIPPAPALPPLASRMKKRENQLPKHKVTSPKVVGKQRKKRLSPVLSPIRKPARVAQLRKESQGPSKTSEGKQQTNPKAKLALADGSSFSSPRAPLSSFSVNVPGSPALPLNMRSPKHRKVLGKPIPLTLGKPVQQVVSMDIIVMDDDGQTLRKERRVSKTGVDTNPLNEVAKKSHPKKSSSKPKPSIHVDSEHESEALSQPTQPKRSQRRQPTVIVSDDSESECEIAARLPPPNPRSVTPAKKPISRLGTVEVLIPPPPYRIPPSSKAVSTVKPQPLLTPPKPKPLPSAARPSSFPLIPSPIPRARQLTPIRGLRRKRLFEPPSPPSPSVTDLDLSLDLSELTLDAGLAFDHLEQDIPEYLRPLLEECYQDTCGPHDFSSFIDSFPFDPILQSSRTNSSDELEFRKIGEASYSEVFGIGDVVLKVIPLRDESYKGHGVQEVEGPPPSDAQDVRKEIIVTRAMGEVYGGFVKFLKTYIVKGKYPELLLQLWDEYNDRKGSESIRPDTFKLSQVYAIIVLPNGGPDLETYSFINASKVGWRQACSIFWQVAKSLAHAEHLVSFEHRDLHWGQILVKNVAAQKPRLKTINLNSGLKSRKHRLFMDDQSHGVQTTIIDLGLSRMDAGDGSDGNRVQWTPFDEEVFMGEGEYQFDIYRMMRSHTGDAWEGYHSLTNVMWLHYLATKLLQSKGLKAPLVRKAKGASEAPLPSDSDAFTERDCYEALVDIEEWLGSFLAATFPAHAKAITKSKGRRKTIAGANRTFFKEGPPCAGEVVGYGVKKGWISATALF